MLLHITATSLDPSNNGAPTTRTFNKDEIVIGRLSSCDLHLTDSTISATHAKFTVKKDPLSGEDRIYVEDLGSSNGTSIEQVKLSPFTCMAVEPDQWVRAGQYLLRAVLDSSAPVLALPIEECIEDDFLCCGSGVAIFTPLYKPSPSFTTTGENLIDLKEDDICENSTSESVFKGTLTNHDIIEVDFEAYKLVTIEGTVRNQDGILLSGAEIDGGVLGNTTTDEHGHFSFGPLREGTPFEVTASKEGFNIENKQISGTAGENILLEFKAVKTYSVSGRVLRDGSPLADVLIDAGPFGTVHTDCDGRYVISGVPGNSEFELKASKNGFGFGRQIVHVSQ